MSRYCEHNLRRTVADELATPNVKFVDHLRYRRERRKAKG